MIAWATAQMTGNFWLAFLAAPLIGFLLGALIQRIVIQPIRSAAALTIVATFGLSMIMQETARLTFGAVPKRLLPPIQQTVPLFGIEYEVYRLFAAALAIAALAGFFFIRTAPRWEPGCARCATTATRRSPWASPRTRFTC